MKNTIDNTKTTTAAERDIYEKLRRLTRDELEVVDQLVDAMSGTPHAPKTYTPGFVEALQQLCSDVVRKWMAANAPEHIQKLNVANGTLWLSIALMAEGKNDDAREWLSSVVPSTFETLASMNENYALEVHSRPNSRRL